MVVRLWDRECIGLSPYNCKDFNADFDGDEVQVYPLGEARSLAECSRWSIPLDDSLSLEGMETTVPGHSTHSKDYTRSNFMMHTTVTMREVIGRVQVGPLGSPGQDEAGLCQCLLHMVWRVKPC